MVYGIDNIIKDGMNVRYEVQVIQIYKKTVYVSLQQMGLLSS